MHWLLAALLMVGLALAGSEGPNFPWPNLAGITLMLIFAAIMRNREV